MLRDLLQQHGVRIRAAAEPAQSLSEGMFLKIAEAVAKKHSDSVSECAVNEEDDGFRVGFELYARYEDEDTPVQIELLFNTTKTVKLFVGHLQGTKQLPVPPTNSRETVRALGVLMNETVEAVLVYFRGAVEAAYKALDTGSDTAKARLAKTFKLNDEDLASHLVQFRERSRV